MQTASPSAQARIATLRAQAVKESAQSRAALGTAATMQRAMEFAVAHPDVIEWIGANTGNAFAQSMAEKINRYGSLTPNMIAAIRKVLTQPTPAPAAIDVGRIEHAFDTARNSGLKRLRLSLDTFKFKPAAASSANAGGIYITEGDTYLGKVLGGKFMRTGACSDEQEGRIIAAASDPAKAANAYGQRTGRCAVCSLELTAEESIERSIGPVCASRYGF